ncbi:guanyl-specific ribonuclease [Arthrobacter sp. MMS24-S77]
MSRNRSRLLLTLAGLVIAAVVLVFAVVSGAVVSGTAVNGTAVNGTGPKGADVATSSPRTGATAAPVRSSAAASAATATNTSGLQAVNASQLPKEAQQTLALIAKGGPYPYERDGINFGNFEGLLPKKASGFYQEYTVKTPGESDRGAQRIITGKDGGKFYTPDHYATFKFIVEGK